MKVRCWQEARPREFRRDSIHWTQVGSLSQKCTDQLYSGRIATRKGYRMVIYLN